jgi:hypothetical protein
MSALRSEDETCDGASRRRRNLVTEKKLVGCGGRSSARPACTRGDAAEKPACQSPGFFPGVDPRAIALSFMSKKIFNNANEKFARRSYTDVALVLILSDSAKRWRARATDSADIY